MLCIRSARWESHFCRTGSPGGLRTAAVGAILSCVLALTGVSEAAEALRPDAEHSGSEEEQLRAILAAFEQREEQLNPIWVKYRVEQFQSAAMGRLLDRGSRGPRGAQSGNQYKDLSFSVEAEIARKGQMLRTSRLAPTIEGGKLVPHDAPFVHVYDGKRVIRYDDFRSQGAEARPVYQVSRDPEKAAGYASPTRLAGESVLRTTLRNWRDKKVVYEWTVTWKAADKGERLLALDFKAQNGAVTKAIVLPDLGFGLRQLQVFSPTGVCALDWRDGKYELFEGLPYPVSGVRTEYDANGNIMEKHILKVLSVVTQWDQVPDSLFAMEVPREAELQDVDRKLRIRDPDEAQAYLDAMVRPLWRTTRFWVVVVNVLLVLAICAVWLWRLRSRRARAAKAQ